MLLKISPICTQESAGRVQVAVHDDLRNLTAMEMTLLCYLVELLFILSDGSKWKEKQLCQFVMLTKRHAHVQDVKIIVFHQTWNFRHIDATDEMFSCTLKDVWSDAGELPTLVHSSCWWIQFVRSSSRGRWMLPLFDEDRRLDCADEGQVFRCSVGQKIPKSCLLWLKYMMR